MPVRLGIDVGGTFTKAAAIDVATGDFMARAVVPTTHTAGNGIAEGVVAVLREAAALVERDRRGPIVMVGHSTTLAVNALLEGDLPRVGLVGIGRRPDLGPARKRTDVGHLTLAPGRVLKPIYRFIDGSGGLARERVESIVDDLIAAGVETLVVSEAFAVDDPSSEQAFLDVAAARGLPACAGHELSGLLGLELRTVSALVNAAILPRAQATAHVVEAGLKAAGVAAPLVVLRGDGGATDLKGFAALPLRSLFSGPAASVAGALHHLDLRDGIMLEVGGTSTNIALVQGRRPRLSYVRVGEYATTLRALDVWVAGVAGGSLARARGRKIIGVGPRSAHIAGLRYAAFATPAELQDARATVIAPRPGDPADHLVVDAAGGRFALTVTCAANALGLVGEDAYAGGNTEAARLAYAAAAVRSTPTRTTLPASTSHSPSRRWHGRSRPRSKPPGRISNDSASSVSVAAPAPSSPPLRSRWAGPARSPATPRSFRPSARPPASSRQSRSGTRKTPDQTSSGLPSMPPKLPRSPPAPRPR